MNNTQFNQHLKFLSGKSGLLDKQKMADAPNDLKNQLIDHIVRKRHAIVNDLINPETDLSWLHSMGYLYKASTKQYDFLCTCETLSTIHKINQHN
jgi:hypothetical protein